MASATCARSIACSSIIKRSRSFVAAKIQPTMGIPSSTPTPIRCGLHNLPRISRLSRTLTHVDSLMPQHSATADALMTSLLAVRSSCWAQLSEGAVSKPS